MSASGTETRHARHEAEREVEDILSALTSGMLSGRDFDTKHEALTEARQDVERLTLREQSEAAAFERERRVAVEADLDDLRTRYSELCEAAPAAEREAAELIDQVEAALVRLATMATASRKMLMRSENLHKSIGRPGQPPGMGELVLPSQSTRLRLYALATQQLTAAGVRPDSPAALGAVQRGAKGSTNGRA